MNTQHEIAGQVQTALTRLGFAYDTPGGTWQVSYRRIQQDGRYLVLEIDTNRLPRRVRIADLERPQILTHLSAVVHRPVRLLNSVGLSYVVDLDPRPATSSRRPLPKRVDLTPAPDVPYAFPFGRDRDGVDVWQSLTKTSHVLVGGKSGSGKTTFIHAGLVSLLRQHGPQDLRLVLVDPKAVELTLYAGIPHLGDLGVATSAGAAAAAAGWLSAEVERRQALFQSLGVRSLEAYNSKAADPLPLVLGVFDEFVDLAIQWGGVRSDPFLELVRVASKGRAFGVLLLLASQHPRADVIDSTVRENCGVRIALKVDTTHQSRAILGISGAERIPHSIPGRLGVLGLGDGLRPLQGYHVSGNAISGTVARLRSLTPSPLTAPEQALVRYAVAELGGSFNLEALYLAHKGTEHHLSWRQVRKLGQRWELRGWLRPGVDATSARTVSPELAQIAGVGSR